MFLSFRIGVGIFGDLLFVIFTENKTKVFNNLLGYKTRIKSIWDFCVFFCFE